MSKQHTDHKDKHVLNNVCSSVDQALGLEEDSFYCILRPLVVSFLHCFLLVCLFVYFFVPSFVLSFVGSFVRLIVPSFFRSSVRSCVYFLVCLSVRLFSSLFVCLFAFWRGGPDRLKNKYFDPGFRAKSW